MSGCVIVPAHNEEHVIARTLAPLAEMASTGEIELIVVANGCSDRTVEAAKTVESARVVDLPVPSKAAALNAASVVATRWPRLYLDADIDISPQAVRDVLRALEEGPELAARPAARYDTTGATWAVRAFYRARQRLPETRSHLWGAGAYALSEEGHRRLSQFPEVTADDLYVDNLFLEREKAVVATEPVTVRVPRDMHNLFNVLVRTYRGNAEVGLHEASRRPETTGRTLRQLLRSATGPGKAWDALTYAVIVVVARGLARRTHTRWARDESTRSALVGGGV